MASEPGDIAETAVNKRRSACRGRDSSQDYPQIPRTKLSMEGQSAKEVADVLDRYKLKKVVVAMDTLPPSLEGIENGSITATIAQKPFTMGHTSLRLAADLYLNKLPSMSMDFAAHPNSLLPRLVDTGTALIDKVPSRRVSRGRQAGQGAWILTPFVERGRYEEAVPARFKTLMERNA